MHNHIHQIDGTNAYCDLSHEFHKWLPTEMLVSLFPRDNIKPSVSSIGKVDTGEGYCDK